MCFCFSSIASGYYGAALPFGASLSPFWLQPCSFGSSWALLGSLLALFFSTLFSLFGLSWPLLGLSWASSGALLSLLRHAWELSWKEIALGLLFGALLVHFLGPKSDPEIAVVFTIYGSRC